LAFARANGLDRVTLDAPDARIGIAAPGKAYLDLRQALEDLGIDDERARAMGLRLYKIGLSWPLETEGALAFAGGLDEIIVVEEKRAFIESQLKEALYHLPADKRPRIVGKTDEKGAPLLPSTNQLSPAIIARMLAGRLPLGEAEERAKAHLAFLDEKALAADRPPAAMRTPYFCSGCPHNTSTRVPDGSRAFAGTGCHLMAGFMNRQTLSFLHMGAEGANWVGQAPFTDTNHVFQNLGDGTFVHSGCLAIRQALAADVNITYKILYNDAVAMTGGQPFEGGMTVPDMTRMVYHEGVKRIAVVADDLAKYPAGLDFAPGTTFHERHDLDHVQRELRGWPGVSVIVYDQTCAAELRRRRKRGQIPEPTRRVYINHHVCEGCGDCSVKSNCLSVVPRETWLGTKRAIDQSSCNKDFSCLDGFCPAFVTLEGAEVRKRTGSDAAPPEVPRPPPPAALDRPSGILIPGIGGTGVVTTGQLIAVAAHLDGKGVSTLDFAGLAQKGGGVACHVRITDDPAETHPARLPVGGADLLLGGDMVLSAAPESMIAVRKDRTRAVINGTVAATANNVLDADYAIDAGALAGVIESAIGQGNAHFVEATRIAEEITGDAVTANAFLLGYAVQRGWVPVSLESILRAIELNGVAVGKNLQAFGWGRLAAHDGAALAKSIGNPHAEPDDTAETTDSLIAKLAAFLVGYQNEAYGARFQALVSTVREAERKLGDDTALTEAVARAYFRLLAYKDEYEVARLYTESAFEDELRKRFAGSFKIRHHMAPPVFARRDPDTGHLEKREFGPWMWTAMRGLARLRPLRGTPFDVFGYTAERREERALIRDYEATVAQLLAGLTRESHAKAVEIAALAGRIRGFGHVKQRNIAAYRADHETLMAAYREAPAHPARTPEPETA
jgi:indolepyruvate ferredoxin oxidoreductase